MLERLLWMAICLSVTSIVFGQDVSTPEKGSAERKAILDALRVPVERELKQPIVFVTDNF
jgi:hypothetical protein